MSVDTLMENIRYYRLHNYPEQMALLHLLPDICKEMGNVRTLAATRARVPLRARLPLVLSISASLTPTFAPFSGEAGRD